MVNIKDINFDSYKETYFDLIPLLKECSIFDKMIYALDIDNMDTNNEYISDKIKAYRYISMYNIHNTESGNSPEIIILTYEGEPLFIVYNYGYDDLDKRDYQQIIDTKSLKDRFDSFIKDILKKKCIDEIDAADYSIITNTTTEVELTYTLDVTSFIPGYHNIAYYNNKLVKVNTRYPVTNQMSIIYDDIEKVVDISELRFVAFER